jgi:hypothetical protein
MYLFNDNKYFLSWDLVISPIFYFGLLKFADLYNKSENGKNQADVIYNNYEYLLH